MDVGGPGDRLADLRQHLVALFVVGGGGQQIHRTFDQKEWVVRAVRRDHFEVGRWLEAGGLWFVEGLARPL